MSTATDRLRRIDGTSVGTAIAAIVAVIGILSVFTAAIDLSGIVEDRFQIMVGIGGVGIGVILVKRWIDAEDEGYRPPERERAIPVDVPGDELDELLLLRSRAHTTEAIRFYRSETRDVLQRVAIDVLETHRGYTEEEARNRLRDGRWTDDEVAATFFQYGGSGASEELANSIPRSGDREHPYTRRARHTVEALTAITEGDR